MERAIARSVELRACSGGGLIVLAGVADAVVDGLGRSW